MSNQKVWTGFACFGINQTEPGHAWLFNCLTSWVSCSLLSIDQPINQSTTGHCLFHKTVPCRFFHVLFAKDAGLFNLGGDTHVFEYGDAASPFSIWSTNQPLILRRRLRGCRALKALVKAQLLMLVVGILSPLEWRDSMIPCGNPCSSDSMRSFHVGFWYCWIEYCGNTF